MVDEETQRIRDEVLRAMAEQGEDLEALGLEVPTDLDDAAAPVALPAWDHVAEVAADAGADEALGDEASLSPEDVERLFLAAVFDDVRAHSAEAALVSPADWLEAGLVPEHFAADDWEMFVYEYLEDRAAERAEAAAATQPAAPIRTATRTVGVPRMFRTEEPEESEDACLPERSVEDDFPNCRPEHSTVQWTVEPRAPRSGAQGAAAQAAEESKDPERRDSARPADAPAPLPCDDIATLVGKHSYYLYSTDRMTDAYARWAFLAREDDRVLTFVECVRDESRKYPRPMEASSLTNEPFKLSAEEIDELWQTVRDSGAYPDLETLTASNGDVYYFSTNYLTPAYAASLAEWNSVERDMFL